MSLLATPLAFLFFFSGFAVADISAPDCNSTWAWSYNSLGQNPCWVAAYMLSICGNDTFTMWPLQPGGSYFGPSSAQDSNLCKCNSVTYSLLSACGGCQGGTWIPYSEYVFNCEAVLFPPAFAYPVPTGTRVPFWAVVPPSNDSWNFNISHAISDAVELSPGMIFSVAISGGPTATPKPIGGHRSKAGLIAGGIVGGIAGISLLVAALFFYWRRRRSQASYAAPSAPESADDRQSAFVAFNTPMLSQTPSRASSHRNLYSVSPVPAS